MLKIDFLLLLLHYILYFLYFQSIFILNYNQIITKYYESHKCEFNYVSLKIFEKSLFSVFIALDINFQKI